MKGKACIELQEESLMISGDLDFVTVVSLWNESLPLIAKSPTLHFDFSQVKTSNNAGLALLLEWIKFAKQHHKSISFSSLPEQLISTAKVCGIDKMLLA
jgi:phospholipid transport system transporter-binding protein